MIGKLEAGKWTYPEKACCPFHEEKTPSFNMRHGHFVCFGCGVTGTLPELRLYETTHSTMLRDVIAAEFRSRAQSAAHLRRWIQIAQALEDADESLLADIMKEPDIGNGTPEETARALRAAMARDQERGA